MSAAPVHAGQLHALKEALRGSDLLRVGELLAPLSTSERAAFRREAMPEISAGLKAGVEGVQDIWRVPAGGLMVDDAFEARLRTARQSLDACRLAAVGLGLKKEVDSALFSPRITTHSWPGRAVSPSESFAYQAGLLLLSREDSWREEVLIRLLNGDQRTGWAGEGVLELALRLLEEGRGPQQAVLAAAAHHARRLCFRLWANNQQPFWDSAVGRVVTWAALEMRDGSPLNDYDGRVVAGLVQAVSEGKLERSAILDLTFQRLAEASRSQDATWWGRFFEALAITDQEAGERAESVLDLVGATNGRAVSLGLGALTKLLRRRAVEPAAASPVLALAVNSSAAGSAKAAVTLLRRCAELDPNTRLAALTAALAALQHPKPAVHDALLQWLESDTWWRDDPEALYLVAEAAVRAPAAVAVRLDPLMPPDGVEARGPGADTPAPADLAEELRRDLDARIAAEEGGGQREWLQSLRAAVNGGPLPAWEPDLLPRWRHSPRFPVPTSMEEAAHILLRVTTGVLSLEDWERLAVGARLRPTEAERAMLPRLLDPVLRLRAEVEDTTAPARSADWNGRYGALILAEAWSGLPAVPLPDARWAGSWRGSATRVRVETMIAALKRGETRPALGTPTHESGWLDPLEFARRLEAWGDLPAEELWELSAALYRLAPEPEARSGAWTKIRPLLPRLGQPAGMMITAALAEGRAAQQAETELLEWFQGFFAPRGGPPTSIGDWARSLLGRKRPPTEPQAQEFDLPFRTRLLTAALRCRYGVSRIPALEALREQLSWAYRLLLDRDARVRLQHDWHAEAGNWVATAGFQPELAIVATSAYYFSVPSAFEFPPVGQELIPMILDQDSFNTWGVQPQSAVGLLHQPECPVRPFLPLLFGALHYSTEQSAAIVGLLAAALRDGRLLLKDITEAAVAALADRKQKPRAVMAALELLARQYPPARDAAIVVAERVLAVSGEAMNAGDRVRLLELLLQWHSERDSAPAPEPARSVLEALAARGKSTRAGVLSRQVLDLPHRVRASADEAVRIHDIRVMAECSGAVPVHQDIKPVMI